jgi:hypothetical protein
MNELIDNNPDINVKESEYKRLLGYPHHYEIEGRAHELADWARQWYTENGHPWVYAINIADLDLSNQKLRIDNIEFSSKKLHSQFEKAGVHGTMLVAASAGKECEEKARELWLEGKPDEYFFLEVFGSAVVEHLITTTGFRFCDWAEQNNMGVLPHYSPGYAGWNIEDQNKILQLIRQKKNQELPGEITILETGMLKPKKSMLALFGITKHLDKVQNLRELIPCKSCSLVSCQYRREPYRYPRTQIEDVHQLEPNTQIKPTNGNGYNTLTQNAKYSINHKALQKWSQERLQLKVLDDNSIEASFRYEGTTCSNMGHKLEFDYLVKLSSPSDDYKITGLNCIPANGDSGYTQMCEYIQDSEVLMNKIENEKPLFGKPLNDVLNWKRQFSPEGCYCNSESRNYKWGLALEVLHYALVNKGIEV